MSDPSPARKMLLGGPSWETTSVSDLPTKAFALSRNPLSVAQLARSKTTNAAIKNDFIQETPSYKSASPDHGARRESISPLGASVT